MEKINLEHNLLMGNPIYLGDIPTYSITLGQMVNFSYGGYVACNNLINLLCMSDDKSSEYLNRESSTWEFLLNSIYCELLEIQKQNLTSNNTNNFLLFSLPLFLELFFQENVKFNTDGYFILENTNKICLSENNFNDFRLILKERNCLSDSDEADYDNPANDMAKKLLEKRKKLRNKVKRLKHTDSEINLADLISIFAEANHMPLQDVYNRYDMYQFNNQFNRLKIMEDYQVNIKALLAGAKSEDIDFQHWLSKIQNNEE